MKILDKTLLFTVAICIFLGCTPDKRKTGATVIFDNIEEFEFNTFDPLTFRPISLIEDSLSEIHYIDAKQPLVGNLNINEDQFLVYLDDGYELKIARDNDKIKFKGKGADINNRLVKFQQMKKKYDTRTPFFDLDYNDFLIRIDSLNSEINQLQKEIKGEKNQQLLSDFFTAYIMAQKLNYALANINLYDRNTPIPKAIQSSFDELPQFGYLLDIGNADYIIALHLYQDALVGPQSWKQEYSENDSLKNLYNVLVFNGISELSLKQNLEEFFYAKTIFSELTSNGISNNYLQLSERFSSENPNSDYIKPIEDYQREMDVLLGAPFPDINLLDQSGKVVQIQDFQGKVIYLDIWATWCKPCVEEFPHSISLRQKILDEDILFMYLSMDSDTAKWKSYLHENNNLNGIHLIGQESDTVWKSLMLDGIPRYMLIDRKGNIVNAFAPKPSSEKIIAAIHDLL